jgi:RHH-type transcriptional regulator, rel operon repressor / antitoxin RelB
LHIRFTIEVICEAEEPSRIIPRIEGEVFDFVGDHADEKEVTVDRIGGYLVQVGRAFDEGESLLAVMDSIDQAVHDCWLEYTVFFCIRRTFMPENRVMTLRLEPELRKRLDGLAEAQRRSRSFIAAEAIRQYVAVNEWQIEEIRKGMAEADRGEFASDEQVRHTMNKWTGRKPTRRAK